MSHPTIPIRALPALKPATRAPRLLGEPARVERVLAALQPVVAAEIGADVPTAAWLRSLRLADGEVEVALAPGLSSCGRAIAQGAFDTLRRLLPDTDIYVGAAAA